MTSRKGYQSIMYDIIDACGLNEEKEPVEEKKTGREWTAFREDCISGGTLSDECNLVAATHGGDLVVVMKRLQCGCVLFPSDSEEIVL